MPRKILPLDATTIKNAKPKEKKFKMADGGGLYLLIMPTGGKLWRMDYRFDGKRKELSFKTYPEVSLAEVRKKRDAAREQIAAGIDPGEARKADNAAKIAKTENTFEAIAREWHTKNTGSLSPGYAKQILRRLEKDIFPEIGSCPIDELKAADVLKPLQLIEARQAVETAHRVKLTIGQVFRFATATSRAARDPVVDLKGALTKVKPGHFAALTKPKDVKGLMLAIDGYKGTFIVTCALRIAPLVLLRPGELRHAEWSEIDFDTELWTIPGEKMKMEEDHIVPLSRQVLKVMRELQALTGEGRYLFPSIRSNKRAMSENTINAALRSMGFSEDVMTGHGFRAMARTILDEVLRVRTDFIEHQLAHAVRDANGRSYNRTTHLDARTLMMQLWADYLDGLKVGQPLSHIDWTSRWSGSPL